VRVKTLPLLILLCALLLANCAPSQDAIEPSTVETSSSFEPAETEPVELNVFGAASLTEAFGEIGKLFEADHPGVTVLFNFAGSQQLAQQINEGAPADVLASANKKQMDALIEVGDIDSETQQIFARNRLVVIYPQDNPASVKVLNDLAKAGLKLVFAAQEVPVGQYSLDFLDKAAAEPAFGSAYQDDVLKNVVSYEDNVKAVLAKVALGEADAGIVYTSDISGRDGAKVGRLEIPDALNVIAAYPIAPVKASKNPELAQDFIDLVLSPEGQERLAKFNFIPVAETTGSQ
jgi:molybdate transport system substrate-binding protein